MTGSVVGPPSPVKSTIRTVGFPLSSSVNRADPNQGDGQFMAVEVECGGYLFRPPESLVERKNKQMAELPAEVGDDVTEQVLSRRWYILHYHRSTLLLPLGERLLLVVVEWKRGAK